MHPLSLDSRISRAAALLRAGGIVAYPTETFYALGALASHEDALARLAAAKLRPAGKALPLLGADLAQIEAVASLDPLPLTFVGTGAAGAPLPLTRVGTGAAGAPPLARRLAARFWPGPLTLVLPARPSLSRLVTAGDATVAVRIPGSSIARALAREAGGALVATSANVSGEPPPSRPEDLSPALLGHLDGVLDGGATPGGLPSTIVVLEGGSARLLRAGAVPWEEVAATVGQ